MDQLLEQPEGKERGVCDLAKVLQDAHALKAVALRASAAGSSEDGAEAEVPAKPAKPRKQTRDVDAVKAGPCDHGDLFDYDGINLFKLHPNIVKLTRLEAIMDLDRCVTGDFGYGTPIQATNGHFCRCSSGTRSTTTPSAQCLTRERRSGVRRTSGPAT